MPSSSVTHVKCAVAARPSLLLLSCARPPREAAGVSRMGSAFTRSRVLPPPPHHPSGSGRGLCDAWRRRRSTAALGRPARPPFTSTPHALCFAPPAWHARPHDTHTRRRIIPVATSYYASVPPELNRRREGLTRLAEGSSSLHSRPRQACPTPVHIHTARPVLRSSRLARSPARHAHAAQNLPRGHELLCQCTA